MKHSLPHAILIALLAAPAWAQQVQQINVGNVPPDLIAEDAPASAHMSVNLGQPPAQARSTAVPPTYQQQNQSGLEGASTLPQGGTARVAAAKAADAATLRRISTPGGGAAVERAVFAREPVRVNLAVGRERLVTLPAPALLHVPSDIEAVARMEMIERTIYVTAIVPFTPIRIVAELVDSGQQIPLDFVATDKSASANGELQVSVLEPSTVPNPTVAADATSPADEESPTADMVQLTRHAARQLYAPRRLAYATPGVSQVAVDTAPVAGLLRGASVQTAPLGQWRSGNLYVTAVRVTNQSRYPLEIPLENLRGRWIAATPQHGRIGPAGSETDTTAIYLVCDRSFEACL